MMCAPDIGSTEHVPSDKKQPGNCCHGASLKSECYFRLHWNYLSGDCSSRSKELLTRASRSQMFCIQVEMLLLHMCTVWSPSIPSRPFAMFQIPHTNQEPQTHTYTAEGIYIAHAHSWTTHTDHICSCIVSTHRCIPITYVHTHSPINSKTAHTSLITQTDNSHTHILCTRILTHIPNSYTVTVVHTHTLRLHIHVCTQNTPRPHPLPTHIVTCYHLNASVLCINSVHWL